MASVVLTDIRKSFGSVHALKGVSFELREGEIHALLGENGAGKSTLMNVLYGLLRPDSGTVEVDGRRVAFGTPDDAIRCGIGMVHQHFMLVPTMTVAENVVLGDREAQNFWFRRGKAVEVTRRLAEAYGIPLDPMRTVASLPVGLQQRVEILKCLARRARVLILDEPTAVLTPQEVDDLGEVLRGFRDGGTSIIFISHKLGEVIDFCDRVTVLRQGENVDTVAAAEVDERSLSEMMVGRALSPRRTAPSPRASNAASLEIEDLIVQDDRGSDALRSLRLVVRSEEVYGVAGIDGNGQQELAEALAGARPAVFGSVRLDGVDITDASPRARGDAGMALITEDRQQKGLVLDFELGENLVLRNYRQVPFSRRGWLSRSAIARNAATQIGDYKIVAPDGQVPVSALSGGNQQKVVIAREMGGADRLLVAVNPTRGLDVGAAAYVHDMLLAARDSGRAVLLISTELDEVLALSDRVGVLFRGELHELPREDATPGAIGRLMLGEGGSG